ncbi:MAG TPA: PAS domain S-box protein [Vicinamibacteria bacterium]
MAMSGVVRVLQVCGSDERARRIERTLADGGFQVQGRCVVTEPQFLEALDQEEWDLVITDDSAPALAPEAALRCLKDRGSDLPLIVVASVASEAELVDVMRAGARDYVRSTGLARLVPAVQRELREAAARRQRTESERALRSEEERFRSVVENTGAVLYRLRFDTMSYDYISPGVERLTGYTLDELNAIGFSRLVVSNSRPLPELVEHVAMVQMRAVRQQGEFWADYEIRTKSGEMRWLADRSSPWRDDDGRLLGSVGILMDITDRKRAEEETRLLQALALAIGEAPDLESALRLALQRVCEATGWVLGQAWLPDGDGSALTCSPAWYAQAADLGRFRTLSEKTVVRPGEDLPGLAWQSRQPVWIRDLADSGGFLRTAVASEARLRSAMAVPILNGDDMVGVLEFLTLRQREEDERLMRLVSAVASQLGAVIQRKQAEDALRQSEESFRLLFENNPLPMWVLDEGTLRVIAVNEAAVKHYGYAREEFLQMEMRDLHPPEETPRFLKRMDEMRAGIAAMGPAVWHHRVRSGHLINVEIASHKIDFGGHPASLVVVHDVTDRQRLEQQFLQAQKMEAIGRLAGGVAHDFNNLVAAIAGHGDLMLRRLAPQDPLRRNLEQIRAAADRAATLTRQLLAFGRKQVLQSRVVDLGDVVDQSASLLRRLIGEDIELTIHKKTAARVRTDPVQMEQVIMNLAVNARDAMPRGGRITIEIDEVWLDQAYALSHVSLPPGPYVLLAVSDTGHGMDAETKQHIFEPFFTTKEVGKGTGLGLATVYGIVKQSGGYVWVYSEPGQGSTFKVYLPRVEEAPETPAAPPAAPRSTVAATETILLLEDDAAVRELLKEVLAEEGYDVLEAAQPAEALRMARAHRERIHLLLTDMVMPQMTGADLARELVRERRDLRVLYMSGYTAGAVADRGIMTEPSLFLQKPFSTDDLLAKVRAALEGPPAAFG